MQFTKLFNSILDSTIWRESPSTRLLWITMLAMADRNGEIHASIPGLADRAKVTLDECLEGLECLKSPDHYSRTKDHDGRRIADIDGGWSLLNHGKYRALLSAEERKEYNRRKQAEYRNRVKTCQESLPSVIDSQSQSAKCTHTETEAEAEAENKTPQPPKEEKANLPFPSQEFSEAWAEWVQHRKEIRKKLTPSTIKKQLAALAKMGERKAIQSIARSIENGWVGLFEPETANGQPRHRAEKAASEYGNLDDMDLPTITRK